MKRRILTFMLCVCMAFQLSPAVITVDAAGGYAPKRNDDFIIPAALRSNRDFMMGSTLRGTQANFINKMGLNGNSTYKDFSTNNSLEIGEVSKELRSAGQLSYTFGARVKTSNSRLTGEIETWLSLNGVRYYPQHSSSNAFKDHGIYENANTTYNMGSDSFRFWAATYNAEWYTKATQTKDLAIYLLDEKAPTVESCEIAQNGEKTSVVQLGSTVRFTLNFSEYIRFADDSDSHEPGLQFEILPYGEIVSDPIRLKADFVELYDNKMVFEYTFLDEYSGYEGIKEFYISRIERITQQEDFDAEYDLALLPQEIADAANTPDITVNNLVTDLAGNAAEEVLATDENGAVTGEREIVFNAVKIDSKAPSAQSVGIEKKLTSWRTVAEEDAGLYAKVGDKVQLSVSFDEPVYADAGSATLTLNVKDSTGRPVAVKNDTDISGGTVMTFEEVEITEGMTYTDGAAADGKITPVSIDASSVLDSAGNACGVHDLKDQGIFANRDFALDTLGPAIDLSDPITTFDDDAVFCAPFNIADDDGDGTVSVSGVDTMRGYFYLTGFPSRYSYVSGGDEAYYEKQYFSYYISNTVMTEAELEGRWIPAAERFRTDLPDSCAYYFDLYSGGDAYIYIKIGDIEITNPTIHVMAEDVAGNRNVVSEQIGYTLDMTNPSFGNASRVTASPSQNTPNAYDLSCSITLEDENGINFDAFRASADNGLFTDAGLGSHQYVDIINAPGEDGKTNTITFVMKAVPAGEIPNYNVTFTAEDNSGNESQVTFPFTYNLSSFHILERTTTWDDENGYSSYFIFHRLNAEFTPNAQTILMIKDPYSSDEGYAVTIVDQYYISDDNFNILTDENAQWSYYTRSANSDPQKQILLTPAGGGADFIQDLTAYDAYFGDVSYVLISGDGLTIEDFTNGDPLSVPISITEETIRLTGSSDYINNVSLAPGFDYEPVDWELDPTGGVWQAPAYGEEGLTTYNTSLAGKSIRVRLSLPEINGLEWSDYESVVLKLGYASDDIANNDNPIFETQLSLTEEEQYIVLPESLNEDFFTERTNLEFYIQTFVKWDTAYSYGFYTTSGEVFSCYNSAQQDEAYLQKLTKNTYIDVPNNNGETERVSVLHEQEFGSAQETAQDLGVAKAIDIALSDMTAITLEFAGLGYEQRIRIWNEANGETKDGAEWMMGVTNFERHLIADAINTVYYQTVDPYGGLSDIHTLIFDTRQEAPKISVDFTPSADDGYARERRLVLGELSGGAGEELTVKMIDPEGNISDFPQGDDAIVRDEEYRVFYTVNSAGAIGYTAVKAEKIDVENPVVNIDNQSGSYLGISVTDDVYDEDVSEMELYIRYDDPAYRAILEEYGLLTDEDGFFRVDEFSESAFSARPENTAMGILEYTGSFRPLDNQINAGMTFTAPAGSGGYTGTISMYAVDRVGRQSDIVATDAVNIPEIKFTENEFGYNRDNYPFGAEGNITFPSYSVLLENPAEITEPRLTDRGVRGEIDTENTFGNLYQAMPIYKDGEYTLTVRDHFGDEHEVAYTVPPEAFDGDRLDVYAVNAKDGDTDIVNLSIRSLDNSRFKVELPEDDDYSYEAMQGATIDPSMRAGEATVWRSDGAEGGFGEFYTEVTLRVTKNGTFKVLVENNEGTLTEYLVNVYINREIAELETMWSFPNGRFIDENGDIYTYDYATFVVDTVDPERSLIGENEFNFTYNDAVGTTKTFTITDDYGFVQERTAELDFEIRRSEQGYLDPPDMEISLYANRNGAFQLLGSVGENGRYKELIDMYGGATQYGITTSTISPNNVKTALLPYGGNTSGITYDTAQNATIDGVEVDGDIIRINETDARFSLVMVDENDLLSERFDFDGGFTIDDTPPAIGDVKKTVKGYSVELEITVTDDVSGFDELTVLSPAGVTRGDNVFLYTVGQNGNVVFIVSDECGNFATQAISIAEIDDTQPTARLVAYSPSSDTSQTVLPTISNRDIEAFITFNKNIRELSLEILKDGAYTAATDEDGVSISKNTESSATVTFTKGASVRVQYKALNGQSGTPLEINVPDGVIDKSVPNIVTEVIYNRRDGASRPISATIRAYADNKTIFYGAGAYTEEDPFEEIVYENNVYEYSFTDSAGNVAEVNIDVSEIDEKRLEVYAYDIPEQITATGAEFKLSVNKPATIVLHDGLTTSDSLVVTEPDGGVLTLTAQSAGFYAITATDEAGSKANCYVSIAVGDSMPPTIMADSYYVYVRQGENIASVDDSRLTSGLFVSDDRSDAENIALTVDRSGLPADLSVVGDYAYTVTATDEAGNTTDIRRYLSVYSQSATVVEIDGIFTKNTGVATTTRGEHTIGVSLPSGSVLGTAFEPYQVFCAKGYYTEGQMKPWMTPLTAANIPSGINDEYRYDFEQEGWYTVYVVRQNKEVFLAHLLIQE